MNRLKQYLKIKQLQLDQFLEAVQTWVRHKTLKLVKKLHLQKLKFAWQFIHKKYQPHHPKMVKIYRVFKARAPRGKRLYTAILASLILVLLYPFFSGIFHINLARIFADYHSIMQSSSNQYRFEASNQDLHAFFGDKRFTQAQRFAFQTNHSLFDLRLIDTEGKCPINGDLCNAPETKKTSFDAPVIDFTGLVQTNPKLADLAHNLQADLADIQKQNPPASSSDEDEVVRSAELEKSDSGANDKVTFLQSANNHDLHLSYQIIDKGVKQTLVLPEGSLPTHQFLLSLDNLQVVKSPSGVFVLMDKDQNTLIQISNPVVKDSNGSLGKAAINVFQDPRGVILELGVDQKWFTDKSTSFPLIVENSFVISSERNSAVAQINQALDNLTISGFSPLKISSGVHADFLYENTNTSFQVGFGSKIRGKSQLAFSEIEAPSQVASPSAQTVATASAGVVMNLIQESPDVTVRKNTKLEDQATLKSDLTILEAIAGFSQVSLASNSASLETQKSTLVDAVEVNSAKPSMDIEYKVFPKGVKENIILHSATSSPIEYAMVASGVVPIKDSSGIWNFYSKEASQSASLNSPLFHFAKPLMIDNSNLSSNKLSINIERFNNCSNYLTITSGQDCYKVTISPDKSWLEDASRAYPVSIDPTIVDNTQAAFDAGTKNRIVTSSTPTVQSNYKELPTDPTVIGLFHLNDGSGTSAADSSGGGNNATLSGSTIPTWNTAANSQVGASSLNFNGTTAYVSIPVAVRPDNPNATNVFSMELWFKRGRTGQAEALLFQQNGATNNAGGGLWLAADDTLNCYKLGTSPVNVATVSKVSETTNWHHVACVTDQTGMYLYLDGVLAASDTNNSNWVEDSSDSFLIGANNAASGIANFFQGSIDEVRMIKRALLPEEIRADASRFPYAIFSSSVDDLTCSATALNNMSWSESGVNTGSGETLSDSTSLIAQWNFNETSGTTASQAAGSCGATCNLTLTNFASTGSQDAAVMSGWTSDNKRWGAGALMFDGSDDYATCSDANCGGTTKLDIGTRAWSTGAWIKTTATATSYIMSKGLDTNPSWSLSVNNGRSNVALFYLQQSSGSGYASVYSSAIVNDGKWHYVVGTWNPSGTSLKIYVDGILSGSTTTTAGTFNNDTTSTFDIGRWGQGTGLYKGVIDAPFAFAREMTASEILANYNAGNLDFQTRTGSTSSPDATWEAWKPTTSETQIDAMDSQYQYNTTDTGLVDYWPFDDTNASGSTTSDVKGVNNGTLYGTRFVDGKFGKARKFDGSSHFIDFSAKVLPLGAKSWELWIQTSAVPGAAQYFFANTTGSGDNGDYIGINSAYKLNWESFQGIAGTPRFNVLGSRALNDGSWHHVAGFWDGTTNANAVSIYVDGTLEAQGTAASTETTTQTHNLRIGASTDTPNPLNYYSGLIDELRIYNTNISTSTIQQHYLEGVNNLGAANINNSSDSNLKIEGTRSQKTTLGGQKVDANTVGLWHMDETDTAKFTVDTNSSLTTSLQCYWDLEEVGGAVRYTSYGTSSCDLTANNNPSTTLGKDNAGNHFTNTSSQYLSDANSGPVSTGNIDWSASTWVYLDSKTADRGIMGRNKEWELYYKQSSDRFHFDWYTDNIGTSVSVEATNFGSPSTATWYFITIYHNSSTNQIGISVNNGTANTIAATGGNAVVATFTVGASCTTFSCASYIYMDGRIDGVGLWKKVLSSQEITDLYNSGTGSFYKDTGGFTKDARGGEFSVDNTGHLEQDLVGYWNLNESAGPTSYDSFLTDNLTATGSPTYGAAGKQGNGVTFNGTSQYLSCSDASCGGTNKLDAPATSDWSWGAWVKTSSTGAGRIISKWGGTGTSYLLTLEGAVSNRPQCAISNNSTSDTAQGLTAVNDNNWHHILCVRDYIGSQLSIYIDGTLSNTVTTTLQIADTTSAFTVGAQSDASGFFSGTIDEVSVWGRTLNAQEISDLYNSGSGQTYSGGGGLNLYGLAGDELPTTSDGFYGKSRNFAGTSNPTQELCLNKATDGHGCNGGQSPAALDITGDMSFGGWFKSGTTTPAGISVVSKRSAWRISQGVHNANKWECGWWDTGLAGIRDVGSTDAVTTTWTRVDCVISGTTGTIYINGVSQGTLTITGSRQIGSLFSVGADNGGGIYNGKIDELYVANTAYSASQIAEFYRGGSNQRFGKTISSTDLSSKNRLPFYVASDRPGTFLQATIGNSSVHNYEPDTNTRGLWHLEESAGTGAYLKDSSGLGNDLTPSGTTVVSGKIGKGRNFTGTDYLTCTNANCGGTTKLDFGGNFSVGAWAKRNSTGTSGPVIISKDNGTTATLEYELYFFSTNEINCRVPSGSTIVEATGPQITDTTNWHFYVCSYDGSNVNLYMDGTLVAKTARTGAPNTTTACFVIGGNCPSGTPGGSFVGSIDEPFTSATALSATNVRQIYEAGARTHTITIDFRASLSSTNLITGSSDTSFTVDATGFGATNKGDNIYVGDKIIVKENQNGTEYLAQGTVATVTASSGATTVTAWDAGSTFPTGGFTTGAAVFKWQREYFDITGTTLTTDRNAITRLTLRPINGSAGANVWLDDFESAGDYLTTPSGSAITSTLSRYIQYRTIFSSNDSLVSPSISSATIDYNLGPSMAQLMRHGKWFNYTCSASAGEQPFWWAR